MKASDAPEYSEGGDFVTLRVDARDDAAWRSEYSPFLLILYDAAKDAAFYLHYQESPRTTRRNIRNPTSGRLDADAAQKIRDVKNAIMKGFPQP